MGLGHHQVKQGRGVHGHVRLGRRGEMVTGNRLYVFNGFGDFQKLSAGESSLKAHTH